MASSRRSRPTGPLRLLALISAVATGVVLQSSDVAAAEGVFRCESEEDLDGSACRVDMLPDSALAEMVYERYVRRKRERRGGVVWGLSLSAQWCGGTDEVITF